MALRRVDTTAPELETTIDNAKVARSTSCTIARSTAMPPREMCRSSRSTGRTASWATPTSTAAAARGRQDLGKGTLEGYRCTDDSSGKDWVSRACRLSPPAGAPSTIMMCWSVVADDGVSALVCISPQLALTAARFFGRALQRACAVWSADADYSCWLGMLLLACW